MEGLIISLLTYIPRVVWRIVEVIGEAWLKKREKRGEELGKERALKAVELIGRKHLTEEDYDNFIAELRDTLEESKNGR